MNETEDKLLQMNIYLLFSLYIKVIKPVIVIVVM